MRLNFKKIVSVISLLFLLLLSTSSYAAETSAEGAKDQEFVFKIVDKENPKNWKISVQLLSEKNEAVPLNPNDELEVIAVRVENGDIIEQKIYKADKQGNIDVNLFELYQKKTQVVSDSWFILFPYSYGGVRIENNKSRLRENISETEIKKLQEPEKAAGDSQSTKETKQENQAPTTTSSLPLPDSSKEAQTESNSSEKTRETTTETSSSGEEKSSNQSSNRPVKTDSAKKGSSSTKEKSFSPVPIIVLIVFGVVLFFATIFYFYRKKKEEEFMEMYEQLLYLSKHRSEKRRERRNRKLKS